MKICFKKGILGFDECKNFELVDIDEESIFKLLKSEEEKEFQLVVVSPFDIEEDYEVDIPDGVTKELNIKSHEDVLILTTVTVNSDPKKITTNLRAPIIINLKNNYAEQIILSSEKYKIKHPIMKERN